MRDGHSGRRDWLGLADFPHPLLSDLVSTVKSVHTFLVHGRSVLMVGSIAMTVPPSVGSELLAALRDDMVHVRQVPVREYWQHFGSPHEGDPLVPVQEYRVTGSILADRLDLIGFDASSTLATVSGALAAGRALGNLGFVEIREYELLESMTGREWVDLLASSADDFSEKCEPNLSSRSWLLEQIDGLSFFRKLRAILLAFPESEVMLDSTEPDIRLPEELPVWTSHDAVMALRRKATIRAPIVVLTEGKTDTEFLKVALSILYPHLTDLITFLDYELRPEGGVGALVRTIRSFAAAGILNRLVAIFDNDTAAAEGLRNVDIAALAPQVQILRYPELEFAKNYPTLGPPSRTSPDGQLVYADVNGLAGSIELYLGKDVLTLDDGSLQPVQWTSYSQGIRQYQGEITNKFRIQEKFRVKYKKALEDPDAVREGDWNGLRSILDSIRETARQASYIGDDERT